MRKVFCFAITLLTVLTVGAAGPITGLTGEKKTYADGLFTLETVACLGACGLAPVVTINDQVHAKMTPEGAIALLEELKKEAMAHE